MNEANQIDVTHYDEEFKVNEAYMWHPNYKGKNYDPNYQNENKNNSNDNNSSSSSSHPGTGYNKHYNNNGILNNTKSNLQDKATNVQVTITETVNRDQLFKIQEVLRHPSQYRDELQPNEWPVSGEYTKSFNKICPKKVEVNEATVDEVVGFGHFMKKSDAEVMEAIDLYKALRDDISYGSQDQPAEPPQQDLPPTKYKPDAYYTTIQNSAPREIDCFTIALGKKTYITFTVDIHNQQVNALYGSDTSCSLINYSMFEKLGIT